MVLVRSRVFLVQSGPNRPWGIIGEPTRLAAKAPLELWDIVSSPLRISLIAVQGILITDLKDLEQGPGAVLPSVGRMRIRCAG